MALIFLELNTGVFATITGICAGLLLYNPVLN